MIQVGLLGASGRMGQWVTRLIEQEFSSQMVLSAHVDQNDSKKELFKTDVVIDFSTPIGALDWVKEALLLGTQRKSQIPALVVGSTGWTTDQRIPLKTLGEKTAVITSNNFSEGVGMLLHILEQYSSSLMKLGYTPVIRETHHVHKIDAPSGTALSIQAAIATGAQNKDPIQTHSTRAGEVIGDHEVVFFGSADRLTLSHQAQDRSIFARGAIHAALWLHKKQNKSHYGLFTMQDYYEDL